MRIERKLSEFLLDWRIALATLVVVGMALLSAPLPLSADEVGCGPGRAALEGCTNCDWDVPEFEPCGCCEDYAGDPTCLWCSVEPT
jgi:hypothetical protein